MSKVDRIESFCIPMDDRRADYMVEQGQDFDISDTKRAVATVDIESIHPIIGTSADKGKPFFEIKGHICDVESTFHFPESGEDVHLKLIFSKDDRPEVCYFYNIIDSRREMSELSLKGYYEKESNCNVKELLGERPMPIQATIYKLNDPQLQAPIFAVQVENSLANTINKESSGFDLVKALPELPAMRVASKNNSYQILTQAENTKNMEEIRKDNVRIVNKESTMTIEQAAELSEQETKEQKRRELFDNSVAFNNVDTYTETKNAILKAAEEKKRREEEASRPQPVDEVQPDNKVIPEKIDDYSDEDEKKKENQMQRNANVAQAEAADMDTGYSDGAPDV